jgi:peptidyl-prolyl cis-trans isomerase C
MTSKPEGFSQMSQKALFATVALLGALAMPAFAADAPKVTDPVVARVNGEEIHRSDVLRQLQAASPQLQQLPPQIVYPQILQRMVLVKIISQKGYAAGLQNDKDVKQHVKDLEAQVVAEAYVHKQVEPKITDARIKEKYDELAAKFKPEDEIRARHILITIPAGTAPEAKAKAEADAEAQAVDIIKQLKGGADFAKLAEEKSKDTGSAKQGGDLGYFVHGAMVPAFADAAFGMKVGEISDKPVKTDFGYHIIKVEDKRKSSFPPIAEKKDEISNQLGQELANEEVKDLETKAKIEKFNLDGSPMVEQPKKTDKK